MFSVNIKVLGIPVEARGNISAADPTVGLTESLEDVTLHNVNNGSELSFLYLKLDESPNMKLWDAVHAAIWEALSKLDKASFDESDDGS